MDYEKMYKAVLKTATQWIKDGCSNKEKICLESIFPELRESEDERIRRWLVDYFRSIGKSWIHRDISPEQIIAYLEKQKENPKSADSIPSNCTSNAKCEDRWHKVEDSLPNNGREVLAKDKLGNTLLARYDGEGWDVSVYDDEDYRCHNGVSKWCEIPSEKQKSVDYEHEMWKNCEANFEGGKKEVIEHPEKYGLQKEQKPVVTHGETYHVDTLGTQQVIAGKMPQKPANNVSKEEYVKRFKVLCDAYEIKLPNREYDIYHLCDDLSKLSIDPGKQKPAEWSEEDEEMIGNCIDLLEHFPLPYGEVIGPWKDCIAWLKSLPERFNLQPKQEQNDYITPHKEFFKFIYDRLINVHKENPNVDYMRSFKERLNNLSFGEKQEWSKEDERIIDTIVSVLSQYIDYKAVSGTSSGYATPRYNKEIAWLKSLRPSWKPSEAQLMALHSVIDDESDTIGNEQLKLLYNDLKKLGVKEEPEYYQHFDPDC